MEMMCSGNGIVGNHGNHGSKNPHGELLRPTRNEFPKETSSKLCEWALCWPKITQMSHAKSAKDLPQAAKQENHCSVMQVVANVSKNIPRGIQRTNVH